MGGKDWKRRRECVVRGSMWLGGEGRDGGEEAIGTKLE